MTFSEEERILLVEFVNADQFPGRINFIFPKIQGFLKEKKIPSRWVRFGISTINLMKHGRDQITLSDKDFSKLFEIMDDFRPNRVWITDEICEDQSRKISTVSPIEIIKCSMEEILDNPDFLVPILSPEEPIKKNTRLGYKWEPGNTAAENKIIDNVYLILPKGCGHRIDYSNNPFYRHIKDEKITKRLGCAFCGTLNVKIKKSKDACDNIIAKQIREIAHSRGTSENYPHAILLEQMDDGDYFWSCVRTMQETGLSRYTRLLIAPRTDRIPLLEKLIHEHFRTAGDQGPAIGIYASGVESFSLEELTLYNKGTTPLDCIRAFNIARGLKRTYPDRFSYTGLSFLLFSPWTKPENLHLNMGLIRHLHISRKEAGNIFQSRMRLHRHLAITGLAEHEGVVIEKETDPTLIMNRRKLFANEKPWDFVDGRLKPLSRIVLRFDLFNENDHDKLTQSVKKHFVSIAPDWKSYEDIFLVDFILAMLDVIRKRKNIIDEETLLEEATNLVRERKAPRLLQPNRFRIGDKRYTFQDFIKKAVVAIIKGIKQVLWIEPITDDELTPEIKEYLKNHDLSFASFQTSRVQHMNEHAFVICKDHNTRMQFLDLHESFDSETGQEGRKGGAIEPGDLRNWNDDPNLQKRKKAAIELGKLLGYPQCCVEVFAENHLVRRRPLRWAHYHTRLKSRQAISDYINPFILPEFSFVPCSAECELAEQTYRHIFETLEVNKSIVERENVAYLFSFDEREDDCISLNIIEDKQDQISYDPTTIKDDNRPLTSMIKKGNHLNFLPGQLRVYDDHELVEILTASHGIWFSQKSWCSEEWFQLAHAAVEVRGVLKKKDSEKKSLPLISRWFQHLLGKLDPVIREQTGFKMSEITPYIDKVNVTLANDEFSFQIVFQPSSEDENVFKRGQYISASFVGSELVQENKQISTLDFLLSILERAASKSDIFN